MSDEMYILAKTPSENPYDDFFVHRFLPDGRYVGVLELFNDYAQICIGQPPPYDYDDVWQYQSIDAAVDAWTDWDPTAQPEPEGWYRHPATGRRRPGGDPAKEFVRP